MGRRGCFWAAAGFHRLSAVAHGLPSGLAGAPKVASAPRGQHQGPLAGNPVQSLPRAASLVNELKSLSSFCEENKLKQALVTSIDKSGIKEFNNIQIQYLPAAVYAYNVGKNTLESQK